MQWNNRCVTCRVTIRHPYSTLGIEKDNNNDNARGCWQDADKRKPFTRCDRCQAIVPNEILNRCRSSSTRSDCEHHFNWTGVTRPSNIARRKQRIRSVNNESLTWSMAVYWLVFISGETLLNDEIFGRNRSTSPRWSLHVRMHHFCGTDRNSDAVALTSVRIEGALFQTMWNWPKK